jgi:putative methyltransferase (TIGR04325 family)
MRHIARQILPPIVAEWLRNVRDRRQGALPTEWEYQPAGWPTVEHGGEGWNDDSVVATQLARWPAFVRSVESGAPFGLSLHAAGDPELDYGVHNTVMSFGYVLARASARRSHLVMLDWGGALGQYSIYARALMPDLDIEYHCRDLPQLTRGGRSVLPDGTFHDTDESALARRYDLVLASSSIHYSRDWQATLANLASVTDGYLYLTRQPVVLKVPSFVVIQRPYRHGYHTEYPGWFLNRDALLTEASANDLVPLREFLIAERHIVHGAPEQAEYRGFLFRGPVAEQVA